MKANPWAAITMNVFAWVLWEQVSRVDPQTHKTEMEEIPLESFKTKKECIGGIEKKLDRIKLFENKQRGGTSKKVEMKALGDRKYKIRINKLVSINSLTCKPETIDSPGK